DAVCIDPGHDKEREHQVRQMGDIYQKAERVLVWLDAGVGDEILGGLKPAEHTVMEQSAVMILKFERV
ncbi:hypothetical protein BU25DRAFT_348318, partial [Macroventuria anomochaeta]